MQAQSEKLGLKINKTHKKYQASPSIKQYVRILKQPIIIEFLFCYKAQKSFYFRIGRQINKINEIDYGEVAKPKKVSAFSSILRGIFRTATLKPENTTDYAGTQTKQEIK